MLLDTIGMKSTTSRMLPINYREKKEGSIPINVEHYKTYLTKFNLWTLFESWFKHIEIFLKDNWKNLVTIWRY